LLIGAIEGVYGWFMVRSSLANLDLNLLRTLDVLLTERNVTRTAQQLGVTQPAVSAALARLRRHFDDALLDRVGNRYELTPLAGQLRAETTLALGAVRRVFEASSRFDPATAENEFTIALSDYAALVMGEELARTFARSAPHVRLRIQSPVPQIVDNIAETLRLVDGVVLPHGFVHDVPHTDLFADDWVGIAATDNPLLTNGLTLEQLPEMSWVVTFDSRTAFTPAQQHLRIYGVEPRIVVVVENFIVVPYFVAGTDRVGMVQRRLAERMVGLADVRTFDLPFGTVRMVESFWWHPAHRGDSGHAWLRRTLREIGHRVAGAPGPGLSAGQN
jgi:DNA-binding transcriptional LysR family regulator